MLSLFFLTVAAPSLLENNSNTLTKPEHIVLSMYKNFAIIYNYRSQPSKATHKIDSKIMHTLPWHLSYHFLFEESSPFQITVDLTAAILPLAADNISNLALHPSTINILTLIRTRIFLNRFYLCFFCGIGSSLFKFVAS